LQKHEFSAPEYPLLRRIALKRAPLLSGLTSVLSALNAFRRLPCKPPKTVGIQTGQSVLVPVRTSCSSTFIGSHQQGTVMLDRFAVPLTNHKLINCATGGHRPYHP
jgi:hypothetical protein